MKLAMRQMYVQGRRHLLSMFMLGAYASTLALGAYASPPANAYEANKYEVRGEPLAQADFLMLPPVCKLLFERPGIHQGGQQQYAELFARPEYRMAKDNPHLHHYCWALVHKMRYFRAHGKVERESRFSQFIGDINYVLKNSIKDWQYFHVLLVDQAEMLKIRGDYPNSLLKIDAALRHKPDYERAYALKSNVFLEMGDKSKAAATAQEGLDKNPRSVSLRRQLETLGVKVPTLPHETDADGDKENASGTGTTDVSAQQANGTATSDSNTIATQPAAATTIPVESGPGVESQLNTPPAAGPGNIDKPVTNNDSRPRTNPYCRFCP